MGRLRSFVPRLCWRSLGTVNQPARRQATATRRCDQPSYRECPEKSPPHEPSQKLQESEFCANAQSAIEVDPQERQASASQDAGKVSNYATSRAEDEINDFHLASAEPTNEKVSMPEVELLPPQDKNFADSGISILEEKLKYHEEGRSTSQETTPGNESRVTSSPISFMCPTSTSGEEEDHRGVVSAPPIAGSQGSQKEGKDIVHEANIIRDLQGEAHCSFTGPTMCLSTQANDEESHRAMSLTLSTPETQGKHKEGMEAAKITKVVREEQNEGAICFSTKYTAYHTKEPNTASASAKRLQPEDFNPSLDDEKKSKAKSRKKRRRPCRSTNIKSQSETNPGQPAGTNGKPLSVAESAVAVGDSVDDELRNKEAEEDSLNPQNSGAKAEEPKSLRKHKKKRSKAKGKRRHGRTGKR